MATHRKLSAAGRKAISLAARKRWKLFHAAKRANGEATRHQVVDVVYTVEPPTMPSLLERVLREEVRAKLDSML